MSDYHLSQEKGKPVEIAMPPLPDEQPAQPPVLAQQLQPHAEPEELTSEEQPSRDEKSPEIQPATVEVAPVKDNRVKTNWRELENAKTKAERERDELLVLLKQQQWQQQPQQQQAAPKEDAEYVLPGDNDIVEGKHLTSVQKELRAVKSQLKQFQQQSASALAEARLKSKYPDFDQVVTPEAISALKTIDPDAAYALDATTDLYSKAILAYKTLKNNGIVPQEANEEDKMRIQKNSVKPRPLVSVSPQQGESPLSRANAFANGLTPTLQAQLRKEMEEARKNR